MRILSEHEREQIIFTLEIKLDKFMKICKKCNNEVYLFLINATTLLLDNSLHSINNAMK